MRVGLDVGSTTIKCVVLNDQDEIIYSFYERHGSHILEKTEEILHLVDRKYTKRRRRLFRHLRLRRHGCCQKLGRTLRTGSICGACGGAEARPRHRLYY